MQRELTVDDKEKMIFTFIQIKPIFSHEKFCTSTRFKSESFLNVETGQQGGRYPPFAGLIRPGPAGKRPHAPSPRTRDKSCALEYKNTSP